MVRIKTVIKFHNPFNFNSNNTKVEGPEVSIRVDAPLQLLPASGLGPIGVYCGSKYQPGILSVGR